MKCIQNTPFQGTPPGFSPSGVENDQACAPEENNPIMSEAVRSPLNQEEVPQELLELRIRVELLPELMRQKLLPLCDKLQQVSRLQTRMVRIAQDAVDQLQFDVKYLLFDLEATRRERDAYRKRLEELESPDS
jgi:hypothetical protein